jgi:lipopolysaccharide transport system permease protein
MNQDTSDLPEIIIEPVTGWGFIDLSELWEYRDLLFYMVWRGVKVGYAQSIGGYAWAIIQPAFQVIVFSLVFGGLLALDSGGIPYPLLTTVAVIPWSYMSGTLSGTSNSLVINMGMLGKVYFPRAVFLLNPVFANLVPFTISLILLMGVLLYYQVMPSINYLMLPVLILFMILTPLAIGCWLSSLAIRFRDIQIAMGMLMRMLIYVVPVMYPSEQIPEHLRQWYILNPFVGVVEGFRSSLLGDPFMWDSLMATAIITPILLITGMVYFRRMERIIVDVI